MDFWNGKKILIAVTAGIAAYKIPYLVRLLIKARAQVRVLMTPDAADFVSPLVLSTLSKNEVYADFFDKKSATWNSHVDLGLWADMMLIVPATANTIAKMSQGLSDNLVLATYLSAKCPVYFAPAMDLDMYQHPATKRNIQTLESYGNILIPSDYGDLASGLVGWGRMKAPEQLMEFVQNHWECKKGQHTQLDTLPLKGKKVLITAGPTYEAIDPVRFIGNHSSGKMGIALAEQALYLGAEVILIMGTTSESIPKNVICKSVISTAQMYAAAHQYYDEVDLVIAAAAVSDYTPQYPFKNKIKKKEGSFSIALQPTKDILASLGKIKKHQILVGFALETENEIANAQAKLKRKNLDLIVLNSLKDKGAGFSKTTNKITLIDKHHRVTTYPLQTKKQAAVSIFEKIVALDKLYT